MFAPWMRGEKNWHGSRPRMHHLSVRRVALFPLHLLPPSLSLSLSSLSLCISLSLPARVNRCTRRVPTSCPSPVVCPLPRLAFNSFLSSPSTPFVSPPSSTHHLPPNPVALSPSQADIPPHPLWFAVHLACTCCVNAQPAASARRRNSSLSMLLILFLFFFLFLFPFSFLPGRRDATVVRVCISNAIIIYEGHLTLRRLMQRYIEIIRLIN